MTPHEQRQAAEEFADYWKGKGYEKGQTQPFWLSLLRVLGVARPETAIEFEDKAHIDAAHGFIDGYIPATRVLIEQKSLGKSLRAGIRQSDGSILTPYQQARRYIVDLPLSRHPRWVVTCNFAEFLIYDMERPNAEPESLLLEHLPDELYRLAFLVDEKNEATRREEEVSKAAGDVVGLIYDALLRQYRDPSNPESLKSLNELCVRLVFLLYAEDAGVFRRLQFHDYLKQFPASQARRALIDLFRVLDTPPDRRDPYLEPDLAAFPYVNGGLFSNENLEIPQFTDELLDLVLRKGSEDFDWSGISPVIFGAVFESTLNPETRRKEGMHYTSVANIHKVIDPLFLDDLTRRVDELCQGGNVANVKVLPTTNANGQLDTGNIGTGNNSTFSHSLPPQRRKALLALQSELASLTFLDPACGSGNFLTETYICLRRLENRILGALQGAQGTLDFDGDTVKASIRQFHGIEYNDFACRVAQTALWIAENQMLRETASILHRNLDFLPLKTYDGIVEGNALRMDWSSLLCQCGNVANPNSQSQLETGNIGNGNTSTLATFSYIIGNPPFVGASMMTADQKSEAVAIFGKGRRVNSIDYVGAWFHKAAELMQGTATRAAFVATNSITQGEQVAPLWKPLVERFGLSIDFAHRTFRWDSESNSKAHVHCVIVGFSCGEKNHTDLLTPNGVREDVSRVSGEQIRVLKPIFEGDRVQRVPHVNAYLVSAPDAFVESRGTPLCDVPPMTYGNKPSDDGNLLLSEPERDAILRETPALAPFVRRYVGARDFIANDEIRYCLWLKDASPALYHGSREVMRRLAAVREFRLASSAAPTRALADQPWRFFSAPQTEENYLLVPEVSSERRRYVPVGFMDAQIIAANTVSIVPGATLYHFGVVTSNVHNAWMRTVAGRLEMRYRYSGAIVYNNFPWPEGKGATIDGRRPTTSATTDISTCRMSKVAPDVGCRMSNVAAITATAQMILDARAAHPDCSLKILYDELTMPPDLRKAHQENDRAVMAAYGFSTKMTESECVAELFKRYQALVADGTVGAPASAPRKPQRSAAGGLPPSASLRGGNAAAGE